MKTIGLIGGTSWESTVEYYRIINQETNKRLGKLHSAKIVMYSIDFESILDFQQENFWVKTAGILADAAKRVEKGGADFALLCANTPHKVFNEIQKEISIPMLNIIDATAQEIQRKNMKTVGLLGTKFTMDDGFYQKRMKNFELNTLVPSKEDRIFISDTIYNELCFGKINPTSKKRFLEIIQNLKTNGAEGIILGCTEIPLLINQSDTPLPLFDTTKIHALAAVNQALE